MKKIIKWTLGMFLALFIIGLLGEETTREAVSASSDTALSTTLQWVTVEEFAGSGAMNTRTFNVAASEWRVVWSSRASNPEYGGAGHLMQVFLNKPGDEWPLDLVANGVNQANMSGHSYVRRSGDFYFNVNSANGDWKIEVQVQQ